MKQAASALVYGNEVTLQTYGRDKHGRTIADVLLPDGTNVNHELVKDGCLLVVSDVCARKYHVRRVGDGSARG